MSLEDITQVKEAVIKDRVRFHLHEMSRQSCGQKTVVVA